MSTRAPTTRRTRLSREAMQAQTRERLLTAARQEVARRGAAASVRDIAEAAGYSQGALYAQFGSKEALLLEVLRGHMQAEAAALTALLDAAEAGAAADRAADPGSGLADTSGSLEDRAWARAEAAVLGEIARWAEGLDRDADWSTLALELQLHANRSARAGADAGGDDDARFTAEYDAVYAAHRQVLGALVARLFAVAGRVPPADPMALATGCMALAHGMAVGRPPADAPAADAIAAGPTLMVFLRALLTSAPRSR